MRVALAALSLLVVSLPACSGCADDDLGQDEGQLVHSSAPGGESVVQYPVEGRPNEICVLPNHIEGGDYAKGDGDDETELCSYNFHGTAPGKSVATCPKLVSTNPGVDVQELQDGKTKEETEAATCGSDA